MIKPVAYSVLFQNWPWYRLLLLVRNNRGWLCPLPYQLKYMKQRVVDIEQWQNRTVIPERRETKKWTLWLPQFTVWEEFPKPRRNRNSVLPPKLWRHSSEFRETDMARIFRTEYQTGGELERQRILEFCRGFNNPQICADQCLPMRKLFQARIRTTVNKKVKNSWSLHKVGVIHIPNSQTEEIS